MPRRSAPVPPEDIGPLFAHAATMTPPAGNVIAAPAEAQAPSVVARVAAVAKAVGLDPRGDEWGDISACINEQFDRAIERCRASSDLAQKDVLYDLWAAKVFLDCLMGDFFSVDYVESFAYALEAAEAGLARIAAREEPMPPALSPLPPLPPTPRSIAMDAWQKALDEYWETGTDESFARLHVASEKVREAERAMWTRPRPTGTSSTPKPKRTSTA